MSLRPEQTNLANLAALAKSQSLATLLQALAPSTALVPGRTVEARLLALAGDGTATAQVGSETIDLVLAGREARQPSLQPGATLVLKIDQADTPGTGLRATLVEVRAPVAQTAQPGATVPTAPTGLTPAQPAAAAGAAPAQPATPNVTVSQPLPAPILPAPPPEAVHAGQSNVTGNPLSRQQGMVSPQLAAAASTPRTLAGPLLGQALAKQDSLAPLFANLRAVANAAVPVALPRPMLALIQRALAQAVPVERSPMTAQTLKTAVQNSGLFLEARQAQGSPLQTGGDLKAGLQALRDGLTTLVQSLSAEQGAKPAVAGLAATHADEPQAAPSRPAPPRRDGALVPQAIAEPTLSAGEKPLAVFETLLDQTEAALDRVTLSQYASLPPDGQRTDASPSQRWLTELPLAFQNGTAMLPLQIEKEPPRRDADGVAGPLWRVRFALDVEPMGPLQGVVTLQGRSVGITLWAERDETSRLLRGASPGLEAALADAQFENGTIEIHTGQPRVAQPTAGQFLDRMS